MAKLSATKNPKMLENNGSPSKAELIDRIKELKKVAHEQIPPGSIKTAEPFKSLFPTNSEVLAAVTESMRTEGYDHTQPVIIWEQEGVLVDGHTRRAAAAAAGLETIPATMVSFTDEAEAIRYTYSLQFNRRNLSDADRFTFLEGITEGGANVGTLPGTGKSRDRISDLLTVSTGTAAKYLALLKSDRQDLKEKIRSGELSLNQAEKAIRTDSATPKDPTPRAPGPQQPGRSGVEPDLSRHVSRNNPKIAEEVQAAFLSAIDTARAQQKPEEFINGIESVAYQLHGTISMQTVLDRIKATEEGG